MRLPGVLQVGGSNATGRLTAGRASRFLLLTWPSFKSL